LKSTFQYPSKRYYYLVFVILTIVIFASGYLFYNSRKETLIKEKYQELSTIADLKTKQIVDWRQNIISEGYEFLNNQLFISELDNYIRGKRTSEQIVNRLELVKKYKGFTSASILDVNLYCILCDSPLTYENKDLLNNLLSNKTSLLSSIYPNKDTTSFMIDLYIPLFLKTNNSERLLGLLILQQNPEDYIFPLIQSWPTPSRTSETLLFQVERDSLVYLNKLRHSSKNPFTIKYSIYETSLPAAILARGTTGIVEGFDYRGVPVLADLKRIPGSQWFLVTKIDQDEIFSILKDQITIIALAALVVIFSLIAALIFIWKNQSVNFYRRLHTSELEKTDILLQFESITKEANDIILLLNKEGDIKYANQKAVDIYGYTIEQLYKMNIRDLRDDKLSPDFESIVSQIEKGKGIFYEAVHHKNDGTTFPIEASAIIVKLRGSEFLQTIIRDVTERKNYEELIKKSLLEKDILLKEKDFLLKEIHHRIKNNLQIIASLLRLQTVSIEDEKIKNIFNDSSNRVNSIAMIHQKLYSERVESIKAADYIPDLVTLVEKTYNSGSDKIEIIYDIDDLDLVSDSAVYLGLLINEIVSNSFKHAFPGNVYGHITIKLKQLSENDYLLIIKDDGIGLPENRKTGLGTQLINVISEQLEGTIEVNGTNGTGYSMKFKKSAM
jgi:PAS domain S-box-containing protein